MLKEKIPKKIGFQAKNGESIEVLANRLNRSGYWLTGSLFPIEVFVFPVEVFAFSIDLQLRVTVTCQALNAPTANEPVDPNSID